MLSARRLRCLAVACVAAATLHANAGGGERVVAELHFDLVHGAVIIQATIDGRGPFAMMLDTGADPSVVDLETARTVGLKISAKGEQGSGSGSAVNLAYATTMGSVGLGSLRARHVDAVAMDLSGLGKALGIHLQGVLGRSVMKGRAFQIDYPAQMVRFYEGSPLRGRSAAADTARRTTLRYRYRDDILLSGVKINGKPAVANLDTGSNGAFQVAPKAVALLGLAAEEQRATVSQSTGFNGKAQNRTGQVDKVEVGSIFLDHPTVVFAAKGTGRDDVAWSVRIGSAFLKDFAVTIDDLSHTVRIEKP